MGCPRCCSRCKGGGAGKRHIERWTATIKVVAYARAYNCTQRQGWPFASCTHPSMLPLPPAAENLAMTEATSLVASWAARPLTPCLQHRGGVGEAGGRLAAARQAAGRPWCKRFPVRQVLACCLGPRLSRLDQQVAASLGPQDQGQPHSRDHASSSAATGAVAEIRILDGASRALRASLA